MYRDDDVWQRSDPQPIKNEVASHYFEKLKILEKKGNICGGRCVDSDFVHMNLRFFTSVRDDNGSFGFWKMKLKKRTRKLLCVFHGLALCSLLFFTVASQTQLQISSKEQPCSSFFFILYHSGFLQHSRLRGTIFLSLSSFPFVSVLFWLWHYRILCYSRLFKFGRLKLRVQLKGIFVGEGIYLMLRNFPYLILICIVVLRV